ncbi:hypothetical protein DVJ78_17885 (plasmid) [Humibacter sp. BT305]|nr:hypothetical protein DVJ78_17885 [Humibacter sp. BT305]
MADFDDDELRVLRERAYGPASDIHYDPLALQRLQELERGTTDGEQLEVGSGRTLERSIDPNVDGPDEADPPVSARAGWRLPAWRPRRATVLILLGVALFLVAVVVTLTVVQRVQTDPLQVGAVQIARLSSDPSFEGPVPSNGGSEDTTEAYSDFYGVRAVVAPASNVGFFSTSNVEADAQCLTIYQPELLTVTGEGSSYSGQLFMTGCSAGAFPATATFAITDTAPEGLANAFSPGTALQFVYDRDNNEVVVFHG